MCVHTQLYYRYAGTGYAGTGTHSCTSVPTRYSGIHPSRPAVAENKKFDVQAGAGIVADSNPIKEYEETVNKAKALMNALK